MKLSRFQMFWMAMPNLAPWSMIQPSCSRAPGMNLNMSMQKGSDPHAVFMPDQLIFSQA